jgi:spore coat polysaccharide biosynthesis predicted glycosyltransferase SpsG
MMAARVEEPTTVVLDLMDANEGLVLGLKTEGYKVVVIVGNGWTITDAIVNAADLLVYQSILVNAEASDKIKVGLDYLILGPDYICRPRGKRTIPALVAMGGGVPMEYTDALCECLSKQGISGVVVRGGHLGRAGAVESQHFETVRSPYGLASLQARAEVYVGTLGMMAYESVVMGAVPILVGRSEEHVWTANALQYRGIGYSVGLVRSRDAQYLADFAVSVLHHKGELKKRRKTARGLIDGHGAERVAECLLKM